MRILTGLVAALALLAPAQAAQAAHDAGAAELLRRFDLRTPEARASAAQALAALGPTAMDELFALVSPSAGSAQDLALAHSFGLQPPAELHAFLGGFTRGALAGEHLRPALLVLREAGDARELVRCLELAGPDGGELRAEVISALAGILARDASACEPALAKACQAGEADAECLARALAQARRPETLTALVRLASARAELASISLSALLAQTDALPRPVDGELLRMLRALLAREEHPAQPELLLLAGRLEDDEAVPLLIEQLAASRPALRDNALWSLRRITGLGLGPDAQAWSQWFREESQWWNERAPEVLPLLRSSQAEAQRRALGELGQRFWHRKQLASVLGDYLARASAEGARMACGLLARLGCPSALPALQSRLEDPDPGVQQSVRAALSSLTGKKLPTRSVGLAATQRVSLVPR